MTGRHYEVFADTAGFDIDDCARLVRRDHTGRRLCNIDDCDRIHRAKGLCQKHYDRWDTWGDPSVVKPKFGRLTVAPKAQKRPPKLPGWLDVGRLARVVPREGWERNGACFEQGDTDRFYPNTGENPVDAHKLCRRCPARYACLAVAVALGDHDDHGVWGGTSVRERRGIRKALAQRQEAAA